MSLFKPSNLTPNFESVVYNQPLTLTFQVNSNGSKVTAYRVQILTDFNDKDDPDKNIIGTIYGTFNTPLYNKDIGEILLTQETLKYNGIFLEPNKDYRWRLRLYGEKNNENNENNLISFSVPGYSIDPEENHLRDVDISKGFYVSHNTSTESGKYYLVIAQEDIRNYLFDCVGVTYTKIQSFYEDLRKKNNKFYLVGESTTNEDIEKQKSFFKDKIYPSMYVYLLLYGNNTITLSSDGFYTIHYYKLNYYTNSTDIDLTYMGNGMLVGSTKQIMWTNKYNEDMKINSYAQIAISSDRRGFQPFVNEPETITVLKKEKTSITIDKTLVKKEYLKNITNGNFYILLWNNEEVSNDSNFTYDLVVANARKVISVENLEDNKIKIYISENEEILNYNNNAYTYMVFLYIQRQKIIQVDKNIGENNLVKLTFKEPFDYSPENTQHIHLGYVSNDFDYDRVYITPVEEFDNSDGFAYIYLFKTRSECKDGITNKITQETIDDLIDKKKCFKIINYVSSTGEVTLYGKTQYIPTIQTLYQVFKRNSSNTYDYVTGVRINYSAPNKEPCLGGLQSSVLPLISNHYIDITSDNLTARFDRLFIQPNVGIKDDDYSPNVLEIYNQQYKNRVCITNQYNHFYNKNYYFYSKTKNIDTLDDTMYYITTKNVDNYHYDLGTYVESENADSLYNPQTQYKIYSNFVDCIPEGFFYSRYDKSIKFEIYNLNTMDNEIDQDIYVIKNGKIYLDNTEVNNIPFRDLYIKTICQDSYKDSSGNLVELGINNVPLKEYHYEIMTEDGAVIYSTKETYDGKFHCEFRGCNDDSVYYIKVYIEDNFGKLYTYQAKIPIDYDELTDNTNITIMPLCEQQAIKVNFAPIRQIEASGKLVYQDPYIVANSDSDYPTFYKFDEGKNTISIPDNFSYVMQFKLNSSMLDKNKELQLLVIDVDNAAYLFYIDTRPYLITNGIYSLNENYMKFRIKGRKAAGEVDKIIDNYTGYSDFVKPTQFAYAVSTSSEVNSEYIYILPESIDKVASEYREAFNTVPKSCRDLDTDGVTLKSNTLKLYNEDTTTSGDEVYVVSNTEQYTVSNKQVIEEMPILTFKLTVNSSDDTVDNNDITYSIA